ncbi:MAG: hypothetical protein J6U66_06710, partial [Lachnospiraceae bacterium]|nr:hypothetical protein [Lachnospiraceae bacterium]
MKETKKRFAIGKKMYLFIFATILFAVASVCALSYVISASQIDNYFKRLTSNSARSVASLMDAAYLKELSEAVQSEEYQAIREVAEETEDDTEVIAFLQEKGLWEKYEEQRNLMITYVDDMDDIKYLYAIKWGTAEENLDMYLLDADDVPIAETGYYELREAEFEGTDPTKEIAPVISHGDWGWLCSGYYPVYDEDGSIICHIGCDVGMDDVMKERRENLTYVIISAVVCTVIVLVGAFVFINRTVVWPLNK